MVILCFSELENNRGMKVEWLKTEMAKRKLSQRDVAEAVGLTDAQMSKVLSGSRKLSSEEADSIRRFFGYALPDDEASDLDIRLLRALSQMTEAEKAALEVFLKNFAAQGK